MHCFITFNKSITDEELPESFTNPFNYTPHSLCINATHQLQAQLGDPKQYTKGKMYGVLIVKNSSGNLGFLAAYSGNEKAQSSQISFVPQVFEITNPKGFFREGEAELNKINEAIYNKENSPELKQLHEEFVDITVQINNTVKEAKLTILKAKNDRQIKRVKASNHPDKESIFQQLIKESQTEKSKFTKLKKECKKQIEDVQFKLDVYHQKVNELKQQRKIKSAQLQKRIFDNYFFLNAKGKAKSASIIFQETDAKVPPAGAGDCCAPKLLQYAFLNQLTPIAIAEFWWGPSPKKQIRKHGYFYPACKSKCEPILGHMLTGLNIDKPEQVDSKQSITVLYEDDIIVIIHKPAGLLSVPGKQVNESVYTQAKSLFPNSEGPLIIHRLDMATSGIMVIAKTKSAHENLQKQFLHKTIQKRYVAILEGTVAKDSGTIELPLRVDLEDRPRQMVCFEYGKPALTKWNVVERTHNQTRVHFFPITGRTHQLRVHSAHQNGLNTPIVGDELYGLKNDRLMLHAEEITFVHPSTRKEMNFKYLADF